MARPPFRLPLTDGWSLHSAQPLEQIPNKPLPATVPGCVHTDLLSAGLIPDPFLDSNEQQLKWIADADWVLSTRFPTTEQMRAHDRVDLVFEGLDTLATIEVNGRIVGETANMHRRFRFDVTNLLRDDAANDVAILFRSATRHADALRAEQSPWPSASFDRPYNYVRKMACSWGWDWGPWLTTAGIWRPAALQGWSTARLAVVRPTATVDARDRGRVKIDVELERTSDDPVTICATLRNSAGEEIASITRAHTPITLDAGTVQRWWPRGQGEQALYDLRVDALNEHGESIDSWSRAIGFRTVVLDTSPDATGSAFTFVVNERPLFARGINWIPDDAFPSRITPQRLRERLEAAAAANVDLVRVWGGGLYEDDAFYDICDELGLMVWQDFAFACAAYPEIDLAEEVEAEARDNVDRLMPHPSLVLWNGNNENIWGWFDWGWQRRLDGRPWGAGFYFDLLPRVVAELDPARPYWPGSPYSGSMTIAANADANGCSHIWDVWNQLDFERYRDHTPRFAAEFGWQAPPTWHTLRRSISDDPLTPTSPGMQNHQKAHEGDAKLRRGLHAHVGTPATFDHATFDPATFDQWLWGTQLMQARAVTTGIEHFRSLRGTCMGTIWWQLNDCWPVTSWSVIDSGGQPKPAWYALRAAYSPRLLTIQPRGSSLVLFAINDGVDAWDIAGSVRRLGFAGDVRATQAFSVRVDGLSCASRTIDRDVASSPAPSEELVVADGGGQRALWWFAPDKDLALGVPQLTGDIRASVPGALELVVRAANLVRDVTVMPDRAIAGARASEQLSTLLPGESTTIRITGIEPNDVTALELLSTPRCWSAHSAVHG